MKGPFRYDQVGSLLRTQTLKEAKDAFVKGDISYMDYKKIERAEIKYIVEKQKRLGLQAITDGEFNREYWHYDFIAHIHGIESYIAQGSGKFHGAMNSLKSYFVKDTLSFPEDHPFLDDFRYLKQLCGEDAVAKFSIPGPNMIYYSGVVNNPLFTQHTLYTSLDDLKRDIVEVYQQAIQAFYDAGCRYLQLDDTSWGALFSKEQRDVLVSKGINTETLVKEFAEISERSIAKKPVDMVLTTHCCRGNFRSNWLYEGDYSYVEEALFQAPFDGFFLEYDHERDGSFAPIKNLKQGYVVLGLITSKTGFLESKEAIIKRIKEASQYLPLDRLCLSCQCGFASTEDGNSLTEDEQFKKLLLVKEIAKKVWQDA